MPVACRSCPGVRARRARRAAASVAPAVPAVTAAPAAPVAPAPHTGIPTRRVSRRDPPTSQFRRGPPERLLVDSGIQKCHGCVGDPRLTPKMRGSTHVPRADGDPQLSIGDPGTTFHRHPGLQHTSIRPPSDATPPRYCRFSHFTTYRGPRGAGIGWQSTETAIAGRGCVRGWSKRSMLKPWVSWWSLPRGIAPGSHLPQTAKQLPLHPHTPLP